MAKRLTDSEKWGDAWFMDLPSKYKLFWLYLLDNCDHAGVWKVNFKVASFHIGEHLEHSEVKRIVSDRIMVISDEYWHVKKFIDFQYGGVKNDKVGLSVQKILKNHKIEYNLAPTKPLPSPYQGTKDKDKDKDKVKDIVEVGKKSDLYVSIEKKYAGDSLIKIYDLSEWFKRSDQFISLTSSGYSDFAGFMKSKPAAIFTDQNHLYNAFIQYHKKNTEVRVNRGKLQ